MPIRDFRFRHAALLLTAVVVGTTTLVASDSWPEWRGPSRDGRSAETGLPSSWSPAGENLAWRIPIGARSAPVVFGNRIYVLTITEGDTYATQERLVAIRMPCSMPASSISPRSRS